MTSVLLFTVSILQFQKFSFRSLCLTYYSQIVNIFMGKGKLFRLERMQVCIVKLTALSTFEHVSCQ